MLDRIISRLTNPATLIATAVVALAVVAMVERNVFGVRRLVAGPAQAA